MNVNETSYERTDPPLVEREPRRPPVAATMQGLWPTLLPPRSGLHALFLTQLGVGGGQLPWARCTAIPKSVAHRCQVSRRRQCSPSSSSRKTWRCSPASCSARPNSCVSVCRCKSCSRRSLQRSRCPSFDRAVKKLKKKKREATHRPRASAVSIHRPFNAVAV